MNFFGSLVAMVRQLCHWHFLLLYAVAVAITTLLVFSGLDWAYLVFVMDTVPRNILYVADGLGFLIPLGLLLSLFILHTWRKNPIHKLYGYATLHAILLGFTLSTAIKVFTGRTSPPHHFNGREYVFADNSHDFHFGFMQEQIIGGWPSSHATISFALALTTIYVLRPRWYIQLILFSIAFFISTGVSFGFHWLSEFVAGACLGTAIGIVVGRHYQKLLKTIT